MFQKDEGPKTQQKPEFLIFCCKAKSGKPEQQVRQDRCQRSPKSLCHDGHARNDEPTGNLDSYNSDNVFNIFKKICSEQKLSLLVVTHDEDFAKRTDRIITMEDGKIVA